MLDHIKFNSTQSCTSLVVRACLDIVLVVSYYSFLQLRAVSRVVFNKKGKLNYTTEVNNSVPRSVCTSNEAHILQDIAYGHFLESYTG